MCLYVGMRASLMYMRWCACMPCMRASVYVRAPIPFFV